MPQGNFEPADIRTGKAPEHQKNALNSKLKDLSNAEIKPAKSGKWNDEIIISELELIIEELGHFPSGTELRKMKKSGLSVAMTSHGGVGKFQEILGYEIKKRTRTDKLIISELEQIIEKIDHFPAHAELIKMKKSGLSAAIIKRGEYSKFQEILGYKSKKYRMWTDENILDELSTVINEIGHFPSVTDLLKMDKNALIGAIARRGGIIKFQVMFDYEPKHKSWSEEAVISELKEVIKDINHFPSHAELIKMKKRDLLNAIDKYGGHLKFKKLLGYNVSLQDEYKSKLSSYVNKRGRASEDLIKEIITEWSKIHGKPSPDFNVKLAKGNVIELVCDFDKRIGIDVTNTKASKHTTFTVIKNKWRKKDYRLYLDELWIVVFTDILFIEDYNTLNSISPEDVKIFSIEDLLEELDYSTSLCNINNINNYKNCSFHNKEKLKNRS